MNSNENKCNICGDTLSEPIQTSGPDFLCIRCKKIIDLNKKKKKFNATAVKNALKKAAHFHNNGDFVSFNCFYTEIPCKINPGFKQKNISLDNAFDLTFDHKNPTDGNKGEELVVCLNVINQMKSNIPCDNFKDFIKILANYFEGKIERDFVSKLILMHYEIRMFF